MRRFLSPDQARRFYDRMGAKQDSQAFYEDAALDALIENLRFDDAGSVLEIGCGTGRFAVGLLDRYLPGLPRYCGLDLSFTMARLAARRLHRRSRCLVLRAAAGRGLPFADASFDRVVSTYVLDLLSPQAAQAFLAEAWRVLVPGGLLCLAGITPGTTLPSRALMAAWSWLHRLAPSLVGGCRPIHAAELLAPSEWRVAHRQVVVSYGVASEVVVASKSAA